VPLDNSRHSQHFAGMNGKFFGSEPRLVGDAVLQLDQRQVIARREHHDTTRRLRAAFAIGAVMWPLTGLLDLLVSNGDSARLAYLLSARALGWPMIALGWLVLRSVRDPSPAALRFLDVLVFANASLFVAVMCLGFDGIESRYSTGLLIVVLVRAAAIAEPWWRGIASYACIWLIFPAFMFGMAHFDPQIAAQLANRESLAIFALQNSFLSLGGAACVACGHAVWRARRDAYETRELGRYRLKERIGRGSMGEIWLAHHAGLQKDVALKVMACWDSSDRDAIVRFEREVLAIAGLSHPNTVRILDFGSTPEGIWFYAMELLQGCDLAELLRRGGAFDAPLAVDLMKQACEALAEAHRNGVIHRDIKPSNLFVTTVAGQPDVMKVLDFGLAKFTFDQESTRLTLDGSMLGTPCYMAPEAAGSAKVDARSDVYALGCVLYELLAGRPPFEDETISGILRQHNEVRPLAPSQKRGSPLPAELERLVMRCLEKRPEDRFRDAGQLAAALSSCCA
jgi:eukaryotic-like serine/threonine-protein kinase